MKENRQGFLSRRNHKISELVKQVLKFSSAWRESPQDFFDKLTVLWDRNMRPGSAAAKNVVHTLLGAP